MIYLFCPKKITFVAGSGCSAVKAFRDFYIFDKYNYFINLSFNTYGHLIHPS